MSSEPSRISGHDVVRAMSLAGYTYLGERGGNALLVKDGVELLVPRRAELGEADLMTLAARVGSSVAQLAEILESGGVALAPRGRDSAPRLPTAQASGPEASRVSGVRTRIRRVLVVEDNDEDRRMYAARMRQAGWLVEEAASGAAVLKAAWKFKPDVIVTDLALPGLDGTSAIEHLKRDAETERIPVIVLTGYVGRARDAYHAGCHTFLCKPCLPETLLEIMDSFPRLETATREA